MAESGLDNSAHEVPLALVAFGDRPEAPIRLRPADPPERRWLAAVALGARGRYAAAAALLDRLVRDTSGTPSAVRAHAAITRGAHLRQLGGHGAARRWDGLGLALAGPLTPGEPSPEPGPGLDRAAARVDALLGLAADAIGLGELEPAERLVRASAPAAEAHPSWRPIVRWNWVAAELALCRDHPDQAAELARRALRTARQAKAIRHEVKSGLLLAVAESAAGRSPVTMINMLSELTERANAYGLVTLEWPMQLQLHNLFVARDASAANTYRSRGVQMLGRIALGADPLGRSELVQSPWVPALAMSDLPLSGATHPRETCRSAHPCQTECKNSP